MDIVLNTAYKADILPTLSRICEVFGVGPKTVRKWYDMGAPITMDGDENNTRYSAETMQLHNWRLQRSRESRRKAQD